MFQDASQEDIWSTMFSLICEAQQRQETRGFGTLTGCEAVAEFWPTRIRCSISASTTVLPFAEFAHVTCLWQERTLLSWAPQLSHMHHRTPRHAFSPEAGWIRRGAVAVMSWRLRPNCCALICRAAEKNPGTNDQCMWHGDVSFIATGMYCS